MKKTFSASNPIQNKTSLLDIDLDAFNLDLCLEGDANIPLHNSSYLSYTNKSIENGPKKRKMTCVP